MLESSPVPLPASGEAVGRGVFFGLPCPRFSTSTGVPGTRLNLSFSRSSEILCQTSGGSSTLLILDPYTHALMASALTAVGGLDRVQTTLDQYKLGITSSLEPTGLAQPRGNSK